MEMETVLNHNVMIEVLNLVHEGLYSVDTSPIHLSATLSTFIKLSATDDKPLMDKLA